MTIKGKIQSMYQGTIKPLFKGFADLNKTEAQNIFLTEKLMKPSNWNVSLIQIVDNKRIEEAQYSVDTEQNSRTNFANMNSFDKYQSVLLNMNDDSQTINRNCICSERIGLKKEERIGVDFQTNQSKFVNTYSLESGYGAASDSIRGIMTGLISDFDESRKIRLYNGHVMSLDEERSTINNQFLNHLRIYDLSVRSMDDILNSVTE